MFPHQNANDFINHLQNEMSRNDIYPPHLNIQDGKINRFASVNICRKNCCYYMIFSHQIGAEFGCWRRDIHVKWFIGNRNYHELSPREKENYKYYKKKIDEEKNTKRLQALLEVNHAWQNAKEPDEFHEYLIRKKIKPLYCKQYGNDLIIPVYNHAGKIQSIQYIPKDSSHNKLFHEGASVKNGYLGLGETISSPLRLCEGYATGCSIYEAIGPPVFVCFNAAGLINIGKWIRQKHPKIEIHICADNDKGTETRTGKNTGLIAAINAAKEINARIIYPDFTGVPESESATDFNDLMCLAGIEIVENQLLCS